MDAFVFPDGRDCVIAAFLVIDRPFKSNVAEGVSVRPFTWKITPLGI